MFCHTRIQSSCKDDDGQLASWCRMSPFCNPVCKWHSLCLVPCLLVFLDDVVDEALVRIVDVLKLAVGVGGLVRVTSSRIALVLCDERHDYRLEIFPCCAMADSDEHGTRQWLQMGGLPLSRADCRSDVDGDSVDLGGVPRSSFLNSVWMTTISLFLPCPYTLVRGGSLLPMYFC